MSERGAPTLQKHADPGMNLRRFGGAQTRIGLYTLATATRPKRARVLLGLSVLVDGFEGSLLVSLLRRGGSEDPPEADLPHTDDCRLRM